MKQVTTFVAIAITRSTHGRTPRRRSGLKKSARPRTHRGRTRTSNASSGPRDVSASITSSY